MGGIVGVFYSTMNEFSGALWNLVEHYGVAVEHYGTLLFRQLVVENYRALICSYLMLYVHCI
jgi:hypothetical protein